MSRLIAIALTFALAACGLKGPLVLPPGPAPEPLLGKPAPRAATTTPAKGSGDVSTDQKTQNQ